ncbi:SIS domain-containing protein [Caproiciproducens sp.]
MHPFIEEANTQGEILRACLDKWFAQKNDGALEKAVALFRQKPYKRILFSGMGSSYAAPLCVTGYLTRHGIPAVCVNANEAARYQLELLDGETLLVAVSQSGKSAEVLELLNRNEGRSPVVAVVNDPESPLAKNSDVPLYIHAGSEKFISSKSYLNTLAVLLIFAAGLTGTLDEDFKTNCYKIADWVTDYLVSAQTRREEFLSFLQPSRVIDFIGDGPAGATVFQSGLIFREGPQYPTGPSLCADYTHGYNLLTGPGSTVVIFDPEPKAGSQKQQMLEHTLEKGGMVVLVTPAEVQETERLKVVRHPVLPEELCPMMQILPCDMMMGWLLEVTGK